MRRRSFTKYGVAAVVALVLPGTAPAAGGKTTVPRSFPGTRASRAVSASRAARGHLHRHVGQPSAYASARLKSGTDRRLFNAVSRGATPAGQLPSKKKMDAMQGRLEKAYAARPGTTPAKAKGKAAQSMAQLRGKTNQLATYKARVQTFSNIKDAKTVDRLLAKAKSDPANRAQLADLKRQAKRHPKRTVPISFDAGRTIGTVHRAKPGTAGATSTASKGTFHVRFTPSGKLIAHTLKLEPNR